MMTGRRCNVRTIRPFLWEPCEIPGISGYNMGFLYLGDDSGVITARIQDDLGPRAMWVVETCAGDANPFGVPRRVELGEHGGMGPHDFRPFIHPKLGLSVIWAYATSRGPRGQVIWGQRYAPLDLERGVIGDIYGIPRGQGVSHKNVIPHGDVIIYHPGRGETMTWADTRITRHRDPMDIDLRGGSVPIRLDTQWSLAAFHTTTPTPAGFVYEAWLGFVDNAGVTHAPIYVDTSGLLADTGLRPPSWQTRKIQDVVFPMGIYACPRRPEFVVIAGVQDQATYALYFDAAEVLDALSELSRSLGAS